MKIRIASLLLALALPLAAQEPIAAETEAMFYKAFYLEKGQRDFAGAMALYEQFLAKAPEHKLAADAAKQQFRLLDATGKTKERDAFKAKYEKLLGNIATAPAAGAAGGAGAGGADARPARGEGGDAPRGERPAGAGGPGAGGRMDPAARLADLEKQLAKAKEDGDADKQKEIEAQIERAKTRGQGGQGAQGGQGGRRGGVLMGTKKVAEMTAEELTQLKEGLGNTTRMIDMMKQNGQEEAATKLEGNIDSLKKALEANKLDDAQKAVDAIREAMPRGRRGGGGGEAGGAGGNRGGGGGGGTPGNAGGGGGNNGGGGGGGGR